MIKGLKLTMTGEELRMLIERRAAEHRAKAARWKEEAVRTQDDETTEAPLIPEHICENEVARCAWRAERLIFLRDHLDPSEVFRLGEMDLEFAELLPEPPDTLGPDDSEDLGQYARRISNSPEIVEILNPDHPA